MSDLYQNRNYRELLHVLPSPVTGVRGDSWLIWSLMAELGPLSRAGASSLTIVLSLSMTINIANWLMSWSSPSRSAFCLSSSDSS